MGRSWLRILGSGILAVVLCIWAAVMLAHLTGVDLYEVTGPLGDWPASPTVGLSQHELAFGALASVFGLVGLYMVVGRGVPALGRAYGRWRTEVVPAASLHLEWGAVELEGTAEPIEGTLTSPYTDRECLAFEAEQRENLGPDDDWRVTQNSVRSRPFHVRDDTGTVPVDPAGATLSLDRSVVYHSGTRRRIEGRLEPGETVYVAGEKLEAETDGEAPDGGSTYVGAGDDPGAFLVADASERGAVRRFLAKGALLTLVGVLFVGVGAGMFYGLVMV